MKRCASAIALALAQFGCTHAELVKHATERGLWRVATQAGLVKPTPQAARRRLTGCAAAHENKESTCNLTSICPPRTCRTRV